MSEKHQVEKRSSKEILRYRFKVLSGSHTVSVIDPNRQPPNNIVATRFEEGQTFESNDPLHKVFKNKLYVLEDRKRGIKNHLTPARTGVRRPEDKDSTDSGSDLEETKMVMKTDSDAKDRSTAEVPAPAADADQPDAKPWEPIEQKNGKFKICVAGTTQSVERNLDKKTAEKKCDAHNKTVL